MASENRISNPDTPLDDRPPTQSTSGAPSGLTARDRREVFHQFALYFVPALLVILVGAWLLGHSLEYTAIQPLLIQEREFVALASQRLDDELDTPLRHIKSLVHEAPVQRVYQSAAGGDMKPMEQAFATLIARNPVYSAVRWIDSQGQEKVRVDWDSQRQTPVTRRDLSSKRDRYFVREVADTPQDRTYVSPLDLLVDQGRLVDPPFPTYRVAHRVFGAQGEDRGFLMINVAASQTLATMLRSAGPLQDRLMLLNAQGQWLHSPNKSDDWGHLLGRPGSFGTKYPDIWAAARAQEQGQMRMEGGVWTWATVDLAQAYAGHIQTKEVWKIVGYLPSDVPRAAMVAAWVPVGLSAVLMVVLFGLGAYQLARFSVLRHTTLRAEEEYRSAQQRLQAQQNFRTVFDATSSGLVVVNPAGRVVMVNPEAEHMFGYAPGELNDQPIKLLLPTDVQHSHADWMARYFQQPSNRRMGEGRALVGRRKDGSAITLEIGLSHFRDGAQDFALANITDVSARIHGERLQQYRNHVLQLLVEGVSLEQVLHAIVTGIEAISPRALCSILLLDEGLGTLQLGAAPSLPDDYNSAIHGLKIGDGVGACGTAAFRNERVIAEDLLTDPSWEAFRELVLKADLRACWSQPICDSRHAVLGTFAIYHRQPGRPRDEDISLILEASNLAALAIERRRTEDALAHYRDHLEELVEERSREIRTLNQQLELRVQEAEDASRAKGDFLATMSHEIRTPMNAIIGMTHLALKTPLSPTQSDYLHKVMRSARLLLNIINDILDLSKIEAGRLVIEHEVFDLDGLLETLSSQLAEAASRKQLELLFDIAPDVPSRLLGDELRLGQILLNLGSNAVKFTHAGEVTVRARVAQQDGEDVWLRFEVEDTGIGLSREQCDKLFQSFMQADNSISRRYGGTGLGLAISKQLAQLMGGEIGVSSEPGRGSIFWFTVRMRVIPTEERRLPLRADLRHLKVLVVDDNLSASKFMQMLLEHMSFEVEVVNDGAAALNALREAEQQGKPFALLILDWLMPGLSGADVAQRLFTLGLKQVPPFVVASGVDSSDVAQQAKTLGAALVLQKPVTGSALFDAVLAAMLTAPQDMVQRASETVVDVGAIAGARVLLVEDNLLNQEVALAFLAEAQLRVDVVGDGHEAVEQVQRVAYDLVLMDMQLPVMDGLAATRAIRAQPAFDTLPIVAMTANAMEGDRQRCLQAGMNDHIAKPIDPKLLVAKLLQWIAPGSRRPHALPQNATEPSDAAPTGEEQLHAMEGLDTTLGLSRTGNRVALYRLLLSRFAEDQAEAVQHIQNAIGSADLATAERLAHTLKGLAAQIGAVALEQAARALETALHDRLPTSDLGPLLSSAQNRLTPLIQALREREGAMAFPIHKSAQQTDVDLGQWAPVKKRLMTMLDIGNGAAVHLFKEQQELMQAALGERYEAFSKAIRNFDFDEALALLASDANTGEDTPS